jgi:hypothetical protein
VTIRPHHHQLMFKTYLTTVILLVALSACGRREKPAFFDFDSPTTAQLRAAALPESAMRVRWSAVNLPTQINAGLQTPVTLTLTNLGNKTWPDPKMADPNQISGAYAVRVSYSFVTPGGIGDPPPRQGPRADLLKPVAPGESETLTVVVHAPNQPGEYNLSFELLQECVVWFADVGAETLTVPVRVVTPAVGAFPKSTPTVPSP